MITVYTIIQDGVVKYVGKTSNFTKRKWKHRNRIDTNHSAIPTDIDLSTIEFLPIETFNDEIEALKFEDSMIQKYDTINNGWNKNRSGNICEDMKSYMKDYYQTPEYKAYNRARRQTSEYKAWKKEYMHQYYLRKKKERAAV